MAFEDFMNKIRYLDRLTAKWMMRHFYFMFFQIVLMVVFFFWLFNTLHVIDSSFRDTPTDIVQRALMFQSINSTILVLLVLLNSFWLLYIFSSMQRMTTILRDVSHHLSRLRFKNK